MLHLSYRTYCGTFFKNEKNTNKYNADIRDSSSVNASFWNYKVLKIKTKIESFCIFCFETGWIVLLFCIFSTYTFQAVFKVHQNILITNLELIHINKCQFLEKIM